MSNSAVIAMSLAPCYNLYALGNGLVVGQRTLDWHNRRELVSNFIKSRREGLSPQIIKFYRAYLTRSIVVVGLHVTGQDIADFLKSLKCSGGGKHAYYRSLRCFYRWLYSLRSGYNLNPQNNPMLTLNAPIRDRRIMPSLTEEQVEYLVSCSSDLRDKAIIFLLFDSGMRLRELTNIERNNINWDTNTIIIIGKGNKQRRAPFTTKTGRLLRVYLDNNHNGGTIWGLSTYGIQNMLKRLSHRTGIQCNAHSFRRGFACNLHRKGLSTLDIMHLGGWQDLSMVLRYTRSITFEDCLKHYHSLNGRH